MALAMTMLLLLVIMCATLLGLVASNLGSQTNSGLIYTGGNSIQLTNQRMNETAAFNLAESGVEYTLEWLHEQPLPPANATAFAPTLWGGTITNTQTPRSVVNFGGGSFSIEIYPSTGNPGANQKQYLIESMGVYNGAVYDLQDYCWQTSFGKYAYFTNVDPGDGWWVCGLSTMDGPVHSNEADGVETNVLWYSGSTNKQWLIYNGPDAYTCSAPAINWADNEWTNQGVGPQTAADWNSIAVGGQGSIHTGVAQIPLPTVNTVQETAALGTQAAPTNIGVAVPSALGTTAAGIYIHGAITNMVLSAPGGTTQQIVVSQTDANGKPLTTTIVMNPSTNQTTVTAVDGPTGNQTTSTSTYAGVTNGVVYCDSTVGVSESNPGEGLSGTIADNLYSPSGVLEHKNGLTIATAPGANVYLNGDVMYNTPRPRDSNDNFVSEQSPACASFVQNAGQFGVVTSTMEVLQYNAAGNNQVNYEIDGVTMSTGTFDFQAWGTPGFNRFDAMGGYIAGSAGIMGEMDLYGDLIAGYDDHYTYDDRLADNPPPFYPTTGNQYDTLSWTHVTNTLQ